MKSFTIILPALFFLSYRALSFFAEGYVVNADAGERLPGVEIFGEDSVALATTNSAGEFRVENLSGESVFLHFSKNGFIDRKVKVKPGGGEIKVEMFEKIYDADAVIVTAERNPGVLKNSPTLVELVSEREIERSGATEVVDVLEDLVGADFSPNAHGRNMSLRGLGPEYVLILVDGERVAGDMLGNVDFSRFNSADVERVEIVKGAASALYGSGAVGGVVNIITKKPKENLDLNGYAKYSDYNSIDFGASAGAKLDKFRSKTDFNFSGSDGYDLNPETVFRTVEKFRDFTIGQRLAYDPSEKLKLRAKGNFYELERFDAASEYTFKHRKYNDYFYNFGADYEFSQSAAISADWSSDLYETKDVLDKLDEVRPADAHNINSARISSAFDIGRTENFAGAELNLEKVESERTLGGAKRSHNAAFFIQTQYGLTEKIELVPGLRLNDHSDYGSYLTPSLSARLGLENWNFRASAGRAFKAPTLKELYMNWDHGGAGPFVYGSDDLKPEISMNYALSAEWIFPRFAGSVSLFRTELNDMIDAYPEAGEPNTFYYRNVAEALTQGAELRFKYGLGKYFRFEAGYSHIDARNLKTDKRLYGRASDLATFKVEFFSAEQKLYANFRIKYTGDKLYDLQTDPETGEEIEVTQSPYAIAKITAGKDFFDVLNVYAGIDNIFDYVDKNYLTTPGRTFYVGLRLNYSQNFSKKQKGTT